MIMVINQIQDSDVIVLNSIDSYLKSQNVPAYLDPRERLAVTEQARDNLYSDIATRTPRIAAYILSADMERDEFAKGLFKAMYRHVLDPAFVKILLDYLAHRNDPDENSVTGALLTKLMQKHFNTSPKAETDKKKGKTEEASITEKDFEDVEHIRLALYTLFANEIAIIRTKYPELKEGCLCSLATAIAMNNVDTITEIISADLPVTAEVFNMLKNPGNVIRAALLLKAADYTKLTKNQEAFIDSLKRWVYDKLDTISTQECYQFLVNVYGSVEPNVSEYLIQIKDCSKQYRNLTEVVKFIVKK